MRLARVLAMTTDMRTPAPETLYAAYGSNLQVEQMRLRCPGAIRVGSAWLEGYRLIFRRTADVEPCVDSRVPVGLWRLTRRDERALDAYEGVKLRVYERFFLPTRTPTGVEEALVYRMYSGEYAPPPEAYLKRILEGYAHWEFDASIVTAAVKAS